MRSALALLAALAIAGCDAPAAEPAAHAADQSSDTATVQEPKDRPGDFRRAIRVSVDTKYNIVCYANKEENALSCAYSPKAIP